RRTADGGEPGAVRGVADDPVRSQVTARDRKDAHDAGLHALRHRSRYEALMRRLTVFNQLSLDGYFVDSRGDMSWAHRDDVEWRAFVAENSGGGGALLFG